MGWVEEKKQLDRIRVQARRDRFAAAALGGMCVDLTPKDVAMIANGMTRAPELITAAWKLADLMLESE